MPRIIRFEGRAYATPEKSALASAGRATGASGLPRDQTNPRIRPNSIGLAIYERKRTQFPAASGPELDCKGETAAILQGSPPVKFPHTPGTVLSTNTPHEDRRCRAGHTGQTRSGRRSARSPRRVPGDPPHTTRQWLRAALQTTSNGYNLWFPSRRHEIMALPLDVSWKGIERRKLIVSLGLASLATPLLACAGQADPGRRTGCPRPGGSAWRSERSA